MSVERQVVRALGSISGATFLSRVLGFVRDMVVALLFGAGPVTDAFFVAFRIPNMLRRLLAEGALSTAVVPVFSEYVETRPREEFVGMVRAVLGAAILALGVTTIVGIVGAPWILRVIAPGFTDDAAQADLAVLLTRVMFPYLPLVGLAALAMGVLQIHGHFFAASIGPAVVNVGMIAGVVLFARHVQPPILALAIGVLIGGVAQLAVQIPSLIRCHLLVGPAHDLRHPALGRVTRLLLPAAFGLAAVQVSVFVNTLLASLLPPGSISFLYYADRVMEFPLGFYVAVPATVGLVMLRTPITRVLFERGQFTAPDTVATAQALLWYAVGLAGFSGARIVAQAFYAIGDASTAVKLGILSVAVNVASALLLMAPLAHGGLALASSIGAYANLGFLVIIARRRFGALGVRSIAWSLGRTATASLALAAWCAVLLRWWPSATTRAVEAGWLVGAIAGGALAFWVASGALAATERNALAAI